MSGRKRTFAIGDIHGDRVALDALLERLPTLGPDDTVVFMGDYLDRGPDGRGVVERVRAFQRSTPAKVVCLRGNHEDKWSQCYEKPDAAFMIAVPNGCAHTFRSYTGGPPLGADESLARSEFARFLDVKSWLPEEVAAWMAELPLWYEDEHAIYVHAGLDGEGDAWKHPGEGREHPLLWMREPDFFTRYQGKRVVFGHTHVAELPLDHLGAISRLFDDPKDVWRRGDLIGIDTGCGKGGFLSAIELPRGKVYESR